MINVVSDISSLSVNAIPVVRLLRVNIFPNSSPLMANAVFDDADLQGLMTNLMLYL